MDFNVTASKKRQSLTPGHIAAGGQNGSQLTMYVSPPSGEISLEDFEGFALERLRVLKSIEDAISRCKKHEELDSLVNELWRKHMREPSPAESLHKDIISHFVLRLAYCQSDELRKWFLTQETTLFRHRFRYQSAQNQKRFLEECQLPYRAIGAAEFEAVRDKLSQVSRSLGQPPVTDDSVYYKVPFEEVPELVAGRRVYLLRGFAFVPRDQLASIVVGHFRAKLSKALIFTNRHWNSKVVDVEKDRLAPIVEALSARYLGADYSKVATRGHVSLADLDSLAKQSFPLCMRHMHNKLREDHHLKNGGRQQFGLFLKGIGLTLEDALQFWRSEFSQKMGVERFDKEYAYNVRYHYGKEGKRVDWTPHSCMKIITSTPGVGDHHGCPFRHFSAENLRVALEGLQMSSSDVDAAMDKAKRHHYQLACAVTFEGTHHQPCEAGINHPNQYFKESRKILEADIEVDVSSSPLTPLPAEGTGGNDMNDSPPDS